MFNFILDYETRLEIHIATIIHDCQKISLGREDEPMINAGWIVSCCSSAAQNRDRR